MLGRIFESFLATLKTETGAQAKKANGAFYTPREIVSYMSRESLRQYLYTALDASAGLKNSIDELLDRPASEWALAGTNSKRDTVAKEDRERIMEALRNIRVLDPAVGSGAFPMGVLHKILSIFERLNPNFDPYETKLSILRNNIYGVDIDPTAIEIARLRAWLSIIVDVEEIKKIKPLPNLDFKFVCANSLVGLEKSSASFTSDDSLKPTLMRIRDEYYATSSKTKKDKLQKEYLKLTHKESLFDTEETRQLKSYQPFENGRSTSFYDPELMHGINAFDVIIGNPPYVGEKGNKSVFSLLKKSTLGEKFYQGKMDLFYLFFHLGLDFLKNAGVMSFITTNYYPTAAGALKLRTDIKDRATILRLANFNKLKIFESALGQKNIITTLRKGNTNEVADCFYTNQTGLATAQKIASILNGTDDKTLYFQHSQSDLYYGKSHCIKSEASDVSQIDFEKGGLLKLDAMFEVSQGVVEAPDKVSKKHAEQFSNYSKGEGVFVINQDELDKLGLDNQEKAIIKKYLNVSDLGRYILTFKNQYLIFSDKNNREQIKNGKFPNLKKHLDKYAPLITSSNRPYGLHRDRSSKINIFEQPKLICKGMFAKPEFTYDDEGYYVGFSFSIIWAKNKDYDLRYLLGLLNSKVGEKWFNQNGKKRGVGVDIGVGVFRLFPIPVISSQNKDTVSRIVTLVGQILIEKKTDPKKHVEDLEAQIDILAYKLYGLSEEEINIIKQSQ
jgi:adenine-specific DNA-methyltransferase